MMAANTLVRRGRPPRVRVQDKELVITVKGVTLKFTRGVIGLRRTDRNPGVSKQEIDYAKGVVSKYLKDEQAEAVHRGTRAF